MPVGVRVTFDRAALLAMVTTGQGPVVRDLLRRGNNVKNQALLNYRSMGIGNKVGTGALLGSHVVQLVTDDDGFPAVIIGSRLRYARWVHEGHGVIVPVRARVLRWPAVNQSAGYQGGRYRGRRRYRAGATAAYVFARRVRPVAGRPWLRDALPAAAR